MAVLPSLGRDFGKSSIFLHQEDDKKCAMKAMLMKIYWEIGLIQAWGMQEPQNNQVHVRYCKFSHGQEAHLNRKWYVSQ